MQGEIYQKIESIFLEHGVSVFGICSAEPLKPFFQNGATRRLGFDARSVMPCLFPYMPTACPESRNLALYSIYPDYHAIIGACLDEIALALTAAFPNFQFKGHVDTSPVDEVKAAALCGLGNIGESGLLIHREYGALHFIGEILTDMQLPSLVRDGLEGCIHCGNCIRSCPCQALGESFARKRCLSDVTQRKGELTGEEISLVQKQGLAWGCDCCSLACPISVKKRDLSCDQVPCVTEENLMDLLQTRAFAWRGEKVLKRNLAILKGEYHGVER